MHSALDNCDCCDDRCDCDCDDYEDIDRLFMMWMI